MNIGDRVIVTATGETDVIDAKVADERGELYRIAKGDAWFDAGSLKPA